MKPELITDITEANELFDLLSQKQLKQVLNPAIRKTLNPIIATAKSNFTSLYKTKTGKALESLGVSPYRRTIGLGAGARIKGKYRGYYARFLDNSTVERYRITKAGERVSTGKIIGSHFFTNAAEANKDNIEASLETNVINQLNKLIQKGKI